MTRVFNVVKSRFDRAYIEFMTILSSRVVAATFRKMRTPIPEGSTTMLDIGCGSGIVGQAVAKTCGVTVTGVDVKDGRRVALPFVLYAGKKLPFEDASFDFVVIFFVLHHLDAPLDLLQEAKRVCRKNIIIAEDTPRNMLQQFFCWLHVKSYGIFHQKITGGAVYALREWTGLFEAAGMEPVETVDVHVFDPYQITTRTLFVLKNKAGQEDTQISATLTTRVNSV